MRGENTPEGPVGYVRVLGARFDTTGVFGVSGSAERPVGRGFPAWATIPSGQDLATGRVVHFFFAWILSGTLLVWLARRPRQRPHPARPCPRHRRPPPPAARHRRPSEAEIPSHARLQHAAETRLCRRAVRAVAADDPDRPRHVADDERGGALPRRHARRPPDGAHHPFRRDAAAGRLLPHPHSDDPGRRPDQRAALDHHRLVPRRRRARRTPSGAHEHAEIQDQPPQIPDRLDCSARGLLTSGCDAFDFLGDRDDPVRNVLESANDLTYRVQRLLAGRDALAQEFSESDIRQPQRPNGVTAPDDDTYKGLLSNDFADWRLEVAGLVERPLSLSRDSSWPCRAAPRSPATTASRAGAASPNGPACRWRWCSTRRR